MHKRKDKFAREIYRYCDKNIGYNVLFPVFTNLYTESGKRNKTSLARYTSKIVNELMWEGILKEVSKEFWEDDEFSIHYGFYEILKHDNLLEEDKTFSKSKGKSGSENDYNFDFTQL